jgi:PST family polysaccharide transporter
MIIIKARSETIIYHDRQINLMSEQKNFDRNTIAKKSKLGVLFLSLKSFGLNILKIVSSISLAKLLSPYDYGVYGVLNSWISSLSYFTDIGLHESLVQKDEDIKRSDVEGYLALRLILSFVVALIFSGTIYFFKDFVDVDSDSPFLLLLGFICLFDAVTTLPKVVLHKELEFKKLTILELISSVFLYIFQIAFAYFGFGFWSFFIGMCIRYLILFVGGLLLKIYAWPKISSISKVRSSLNNGVHFQANLIIIAALGIASPIILKGFLTVEVVGIYFWTMSLVSLPIAYINNFGHVLFSALSKTQKNFDDSKLLISKSCRILILIISLIFGLGATLGPSLIELLFGEKWSLAKDVIALCSLTAGLLAAKELPNAALGALGKPRIRMKIELLGLFLLLTVGTFITSRFYLKGFLIYSAVVNGFIALSLFYKIKEYISLEAMASAVKVVLITGVVFVINRYMEYETSLFKSLISYGALFSTLIFIFDQKTVKELKASLLRTKLKN